MSSKSKKTKQDEKSQVVVALKSLHHLQSRINQLESASKATGGPLIEGYVDVKEQSAKVIPPTTHPDLKAMIRNMGGRVKPKLNNLRTRMAISSTLNGSSGTAITTVINVRPAGFSEFASFAALFDEFKVHGGTLHFNVWATGQNNLVVGNDVAFAYDPVDNAVYASVAGALVASQHIGPITAMGTTDASVPSTAARTAAPQAATAHGFWKFNFKCPLEPQFVPNNSQQVMTGEWCDTNISSSLGDYGYLKPYVTSAGSTTANVSYYLVLDVEFRCRT